MNSALHYVASSLQLLDMKCLPSPTRDAGRGRFRCGILDAVLSGLSPKQCIEYRCVCGALSTPAVGPWIINFTNPAGLITQTVMHHSNARVVGVCDTPTEILHRIQSALHATASEVECEYVGLNHLGWIRKSCCAARMSRNK